MDPIFQDGYLLTLNADRFFKDPGQALLPSDVKAVFLKGKKRNCLKALRLLKASAPSVLAGTAVCSQKEALSAAGAGADYICLMYEPKEPYAEWKDIVPDVFPVCPDSVGETAELMRNGYSVFYIEPKGLKGALETLWSLYKALPEAGFICGGRHSEKEIAALMPFYSVRTVCTRAADSGEKAEKIAKDAFEAVLGFEFAHLGVNTESGEEADTLAQTFAETFGFDTRDNGNSVYASDRIECMKFRQLGTLGHIGIRTNSAARAKEYLIRKGLTPVESTAKYRDGRLHNVYFQEEFGGFAVHLLQKIPAKTE